RLPGDLSPTICVLLHLRSSACGMMHNCAVFFYFTRIDIFTTYYRTSLFVNLKLVFAVISCGMFENLIT
ncbi:hypothetical protein ACJX0J_035338, partial [Zea mays]